MDDAATLGMLGHKKKSVGWINAQLCDALVPHSSCQPRLDLVDHLVLRGQVLFLRFGAGFGGHLPADGDREVVELVRTYSSLHQVR